MAKYTVKSGQNIYDVSMSIYGSVEGVFDLLMCNEWLSMETTLTSGMELEHTENLVVNQNVLSWIDRSGTIFRNGEHPIEVINGLEAFQKHIKTCHKERWEQLISQPEASLDKYWEWLSSPRMLIVCDTATPEIKVSFLKGTHMVIDWGDTTPMEILEGTETLEIDHTYKSATQHKIALFGDFMCEKLDISGVHGTHYATTLVVANEFVPSDNDPKLRELIIPEEDLE